MLWMEFNSKLKALFPDAEYHVASFARLPETHWTARASCDAGLSKSYGIACHVTSEATCATPREAMEVVLAALTEKLVSTKRAKIDGERKLRLEKLARLTFEVNKLTDEIVRLDDLERV